MFRTAKLSSRPKGLLVAAAALILVVIVGIAASPHPQATQATPHATLHATPPSTLRLYVFDCGVIKGLDPGLFGFKKEDVATTEMAVPCYLVVHPEGTLMWDVGAISDTAFTSDN